jgi:hypothetical protein
MFIVVTDILDTVQFVRLKETTRFRKLYLSVSIFRLSQENGKAYCGGPFRKRLISAHFLDVLEDGGGCNPRNCVGSFLT